MTGFVWTLIALWVINIGVSAYNARARYEWIILQRWIISAHPSVVEHADLAEHGQAMIDMGYALNDWVTQSIKIVIPIMVVTQILLIWSILSIMLAGQSYIPIEVIAIAEASALMVGWITYSRYTKSQAGRNTVGEIVQYAAEHKAEKEGPHDNKTSSTDE